jgi:hypothetical protein
MNSDAADSTTAAAPEASKSVSGPEPAARPDASGAPAAHAPKRGPLVPSSTKGPTCYMKPSPPAAGGSAKDGKADATPSRAAYEPPVAGTPIL